MKNKTQKAECVSKYTWKHCQCNGMTLGKLTSAEAVLFKMAAKISDDFNINWQNTFLLEFGVGKIHFKYHFRNLH